MNKPPKHWIELAGHYVDENGMTYLKFTDGSYDPDNQYSLLDWELTEELSDEEFAMWHLIAQGLRADIKKMNRLKDTTLFKVKIKLSDCITELSPSDREFIEGLSAEGLDSFLARQLSSLENQLTAGIMDTVREVSKIALENCIEADTYPDPEPPRLKYLPEKYQSLLSSFGNFSKSGSIEGMRERYYGDKALLVLCGDYIYNVSSEPLYYREASKHGELDDSDTLDKLLAGHVEMISSWRAGCEVSYAGVSYTITLVEENYNEDIGYAQYDVRLPNGKASVRFDTENPLISFEEYAVINIFTEPPSREDNDVNPVQCYGEASAHTAFIRIIEAAKAKVN